MGLPMVTRLRVAARRSLSRLLRSVPAGVTGGVRERYLEASPAGRRALDPVVAVLRHAPLRQPHFVLPDHPGLRLHAVDSRLARLLYWYGDDGFEPGEARWWRRLCAQASSIVELGGNIGYYTVLGADAARATPYTVVEANPEAARMLRDNLELNGLTHVLVRNVAAVGTVTAAEVELALPDQEQYVAPTGAYLREGAEGIVGRPATHTVTVPAAAAAELISGADLLKLDIEGYEAAVLAAAWPQLTASRPIIVVEVLKKVPQLRAVLRDLHAIGYLAFAVGGASLHLLESAQLHADAPLPRYGSRDVILVPAEKASIL